MFLQPEPRAPDHLACPPAITENGAWPKSARSCHAAVNVVALLQTVLGYRLPRARGRGWPDLYTVAKAKDGNVDHPTGPKHAVNPPVSFA